MVTRACISINNRCNLNCTYCHFHEKKDYIQEDNMDVITILDIITSHIEDNDIDLFKLARLIYICYARLIKDFCILVSG